MSSMPELVLIAADTRAHGEAIAAAMSHVPVLGFVFATGLQEAVDQASRMEPSMAIVDLSGGDGPRTCQALRAIDDSGQLRLLAVIDTQEISDIRVATPNGVVLRPASALSVAAESQRVLQRPERRDARRPDRRLERRGGRRMTDVVH